MNLVLHVSFNVHLHQGCLNQRQDIFQQEFLLCLQDITHERVLGVDELCLFAWVFPQFCHVLRIYHLEQSAHCIFSFFVFLLNVEVAPNFV